MMNAETLRMIEEAALADDRRYCETVSTLREIGQNSDDYTEMVGDELIVFAD